MRKKMHNNKLDEFPVKWVESGDLKFSLASGSTFVFKI